jgi:hypothetical protein
MSNELIEETINCLRATFKVTDNVIRKQAEDRLKELGNLYLIQKVMLSIISQFFSN